MTHAEFDLRQAVTFLPEPVRRAMLLGLRSGWYVIKAEGYESPTGMCPLVAAAKIAGVWRDGHAADGGVDWGDETRPNKRCFEFAVAFDLYAGEVGTAVAVDVVLAELGSEHRALAA